MAYNTDISEIQDGESGNATVASRPHQKLLENTNYLKAFTDVQVSRADLQSSTYTAFTTAGSSTAYTLTPTPAISSYSTGQLFIVTPHTTAGATPTMAISGLAVKNLKQYDSTGAKVAVSSTTFIASVRYLILYDGTDLVVLNPLPTTTTTLTSCLIRNERTSGTNNGAATTGSFTALPLNTEVSDPGGICTLSSNQITLSAGTYWVFGFTETRGTTGFITRLYNTTGATELLLGCNAYSDATPNINTAVLMGPITVAAGQALEWQYYAVASSGGAALGAANSAGITEVYSPIFFIKVA